MKKIISILVIFSLLTNLTSCYSYKTLSKQEEYKMYAGNKRIHVLQVQTKEGNEVNFNERFPAQISKKGVSGLPEFRISFDQDSAVFYKGKAITAWKNGVEYDLIGQDKRGLICLVDDPINIPLSDIEYLDYRIYNAPLSFLLIFGTVASGVSILTYIWVNSWTLVL